MRTALAWTALGLVALLLGVGFVRALVGGGFAGNLLRAGPGVVERRRLARDEAARALCEPALRPTDANAALGGIGNEAPDFKLRDYAGREVQLSSLRGRVVMVNFWATWCPTCVVEMQSL